MQNNTVFNYSRSLSKNEVRVDLLNFKNSRDDFKEICDGVSDSSELYHYSFRTIDESYLLNEVGYDQDIVVRLLIIVSNFEYSKGLVDTLIELINQKKYTCISVAFRYPDEKKNAIV